MYKHTSDAAANRKMNIYIYPILRYHTNDNIILAFRAFGSPGWTLRLPFCLGRPLHLIQFQSIIQIEVHSLLLRETSPLNPIGHRILPFAASIQQPDQVFAVHITGFPILDFREPVGPVVINTTALDGKLLFPQVQQKSVVFRVPHDLQRSSMDGNPPRVQIYRYSRLLCLPQRVHFFTHILIS